MASTAGRLGVAGKAVGGFLLGALLAVLIPPLAIAMALVLGGVVVWSHRQADSDQQALTPLAAGFAAAVAVYVVLAVLGALL